MVAIKVMKSWYLLLCCDGAVTIVVVVPFHEVRLSVNSMIACNIIILTISIITCANHISTNTYYILLSVIYSHLLTTIVAQCIPVPINVHYQSRYPYTWWYSFHGIIVPINAHSIISSYWPIYKTVYGIHISIPTPMYTHNVIVPLWFSHFSIDV